jgi:hypothetical protein
MSAQARGKPAKLTVPFHNVIGTDDPDLTEFRRHGGQIITYHGWTDQLIFPRGSIDYFNRVVAAMAGSIPNCTRLIEEPALVLRAAAIASDPPLFAAHCLIVGHIRCPA